MFMAKFMGMHVTAVELDPVVVDVAREHFGVGEEAGVKVVLGDGLEYVARMANALEYKGRVQEDENDKEEETDEAEPARERGVECGG